MSEYLGSCNRFFLPRKLRFRDSFLQNIHQLTTMLVVDIIEKLNKDPRQAKSANSSLAFFLRDSLSLMDRSFVLQLIRDYLVVIGERISAVASEQAQTLLMSLRIQFMRIICSHEHFTLLNLPFDIGPVQLPNNVYQSPFKASGSFSTGVGNLISTITTKTSSTSSISSHESNSTNLAQYLELTTEFKSKHFLIGIILNDLSSSLKSTNVLIQQKCIGLLKSILSTHETDSRLSDLQLKNRLLALYLPLISIIMDVRKNLFDPYGTILNDEMIFPRKKINNIVVNPKIASAISGSILDEKEIKLINSGGILTKEMTQQLLSFLLWIIKNNDKKILKNWLKELTTEKFEQFIDLLQLCISCFEYENNKIGNISTNSSAIMDSSMACDDNDEILSGFIRKCSDNTSLNDEKQQTIKWRFDDVNISMRGKSKLGKEVFI